MKDLLAKMDEEQRKKLVDKQLKRLGASARYYQDYFTKWKNFYKMYYSLKDDAVDTDEPNIWVPIAYGIVEDAVARLVVPLLQKLPVSVKAKIAKYADNAEAFYTACKDYFGADDYRLDRIMSEREYCITGNAWEVYSWKNDVMKGKEWKDVESDEPTEYPIKWLGKIVQTVKKMLPVTKPQEVDKDYPIKVGFHTRFPSVFCMFPEPGVKKFDNASWVIEAEGVVSLADLEKATYIDPETRERKPVYDLTELLKSVDGHKSKIKPENTSWYKEGEDISQIISGRDPNIANESDEPSVFVLRVHQKDNSIITIVQGKFVVQYIGEVYHYPVMPVQLRCYTPDKENMFGTGILEPIIDLLYEVNDVHNMSFQNWIRVINKMVVYDEGVIKYPDDFTPRAGGKIRANLLAGGNVNQAFGVIDHQDVAQSMITMESQTMGKIERTISIADLTPGVQGTKAYHKTYGGLMEIQSNFAKRFSVMAMSDLAYLTKQMRIMYWMFQQFMFDDMATGQFKDGVFMAETYRREDFDSGGQGFLFVQSNDPSFGDAAVQRNQFMVLFEQLMKYEQFRMTVKDPELKRAGVDNILKLLIESFGIQDSTKYLAPANGVLDPAAEFTLMLQGMPVQVNPRENMIEHLLEHVAKRNDPGMLSSIAGGKLPPEIMQALDKHIQETMEMIHLFMENVDQVAQAKQADKTGQTPDYRGGGQGAGAGQGMGGQPSAPNPQSNVNAPMAVNDGNMAGQGGNQI
jgi:hypothetical protein